jgi:mRNA interferase RelE/StbE
LRDESLKRRIAKALHVLEENPRPSGCVKLQGEDELYRVRVGDYRIVYQIRDASLVVLVVQIGHRREIYRP